MLSFSFGVFVDHGFLLTGSDGVQFYSTWPWTSPDAFYVFNTPFLQVSKWVKFKTLNKNWTADVSIYCICGLITALTSLVTTCWVAAWYGPRFALSFSGFLMFHHHIPNVSSSSPRLLIPRCRLMRQRLHVRRLSCCFALRAASSQIKRACTTDLQGSSPPTVQTF